MSKQGSAAKGADNNKRLALLEAGVSALAMGLAANGVNVAEGADVFAIATTTIKRQAKEHSEAVEQISAMGQKVAALEAAGAEEAKHELEQLRAQLAEAVEKVDVLGTELAAARAAAPSAEEVIDGQVEALKEELATALLKTKDLEAEVAELNQDVDDAISERNELRNKLSEDGKSSAIAAVDDEPEVATPAPVRERPESARDVGPTNGSLTADEIQSAIDAGARFEIAFSNGDYELVEFGPTYVAGSDLHRFATQQFAVAPALHIKGGSVGEEIHGAGLLLEGTQVGYCTFDPAVRIEPGQERAFNRALIFG